VRAGDGGDGGAGAPKVVDSSKPGLEVVGAPAGPDGADGADGAESAIVVDNQVALGAGDDRLELRLESGAPDATLRFARNSLDGGTGLDTLDLGGTSWGAVVDVARARLKLGDSPFNTMTGFEAFIGTAGADRFIDGAGNQDYAGSGGADAFVFRPRHGQDTVRFVPGEGDKLVFERFGPELDTAAEILARAFDIATPGGMDAGVFLPTGPGSGIVLVGLRAAELSADMFGFA
jgi:hypothetical protein